MDNFFGFYTQYEKKQTFQGFGFEHICAIIITAIIIAMITYYIGKINKIKAKKFLNILAILVPIVELSHTIWLINCGQTDFRKLLPFHLCAMQVFFIPLAVFTKKQVFKDFVFATSILGGSFGIIFPSGVADNYPFFHFQTIQTLCYHSLLILVPILLIRIGEYKPTIKRLKNSVILFIAIGIPVYILDTILGENYMFLKCPPEVDFIENIFSNYGQTVYLIIMFILLLIASMLIHIPFDMINRVRENKLEVKTDNEKSKDEKCEVKV